MLQETHAAQLWCSVCFWLFWNWLHTSTQIDDDTRISRTLTPRIRKTVGTNLPQGCFSRKHWEIRSSSHTCHGWYDPSYQSICGWSLGTATLLVLESCTNLWLLNPTSTWGSSFQYQGAWSPLPTEIPQRQLAARGARGTMTPRSSRVRRGSSLTPLRSGAGGLVCWVTDVDIGMAATCQVPKLVDVLAYNCWIDFDMVLDICNYLHDRIFKGTNNTRNAIDQMHIYIYYKTSKYGQLDHSFLARTWRPRSSKLLGEAAKVWWNSCDLCYLIWLVIWNILYCCSIYLE